MARTPRTASTEGKISLQPRVDANAVNGTSTYVFAAAMLAIAAWMPWYFELPFLFDITSRDFNPVIVAPVLFGGIGVLSLVRAVFDTLRLRKFGVSTLSGATVLSGNTFRAVIRTSYDLAPTGDYTVKLKCIRRIVAGIGDVNDTRRTSEKVLSREKRTIDARSVKSSQGIPVEFRIASGLPPARGTPKPKDTDASTRWVVTISAPMSGLNYYAKFALNVGRS